MKLKDYFENTRGTGTGIPQYRQVRGSADGFRTLISQHYPKENVKGDFFDLVLIPVEIDPNTCFHFNGST